jgi:alginate O-acetyltransferase complex protein AlgJ
MITAVPMRKWMALAGLALVTLSAAPVNMHFFGNTVSSDVVRHSLGDIVSGRATNEITRLYNDKFLFRNTGIDLFGMLSYGLFREGRRGVLIGADGFLFSAEEYESAPDAQANLAANTDFIARSARTIEASGAKLLVVIVPAKARIYPDKTGRYAWPPEPEGRLQNAAALMQENGINVIDLSETLRAAKSEAPVFLRTDTHWTSFGASAAATAIAAKARGMAELGGEVPVTMIAGKSEPHRGDLLRFIRLGSFAETAGPEPDRLVTWTANVETGETLLGDSIIPVALVGTSYSADPRWSFRAFLANALKADVLNVAAEGKGPFDPMSEYLASALFRDSPPRLVVWEIPERFLDDPRETKPEGKKHG